MNENIWNSPDLSNTLKEIRERENKIERERKIKAEQERETIRQNNKLKKEENLKNGKVIILSDYVEFIFEGKSFFFCKDGFKMFQKELDNKFVIISVDNRGYLHRHLVNNESNEEMFHMDIHRMLMYEKVKELREKLNCLIEDIHVHHIGGGIPNNNKLSNLDVLHKDEHAKRHSTKDKNFSTWEELEEDRVKHKKQEHKKNFLKE